MAHPGARPPTAAGEALLDVDRMNRLVDDLMVLARLDDPSDPARPAAPAADDRPVDELVRRLISQRPPDRVPVSAGTGSPGPWSLPTRLRSSG